MGEMSKSTLVQCLTELPADTIKEARGHLFTKMLSVCKARCNPKNIAAPQQPYLKLKERRGKSAHINRAEDIYDMSAYITQNRKSLPRGPLSQLSSNIGARMGKRQETELGSYLGRKKNAFSSLCRPESQY